METQDALIELASERDTLKALLIAARRTIDEGLSEVRAHLATAQGRCGTCEACKRAQLVVAIDAAIGKAD